ncbi:phenylacetate--CoA ligase family protein [bacterium]|nr:phenylacetate--CoA ligase family protein [bacterium]
MEIGHRLNLAVEAARSPFWFTRIYSNPKRLERFREKRLREVVRFAYRNVLAYRELFDEAGIDASRVWDFDDLTRLPIIDKSFFRSRPLEELCSERGFGQLTSRRTSGSTGVSLLFAHSQRNRLKRILVDLRANMRLGLKPHQTHMVVASPEAMLRGRNPLQKIGLFRREYVSADIDPDEIARAVQRVNPHLLQCYPSHLGLLCDVVNRDRLPNLSRIISAGEVLTVAAREKIERAFGVPVSNYYGLKELGMIAWECDEHDGMHINWDLYHVEQMAESYQLVVTLLDADAMPFVRYNTLDRGRLDFSPCPCGCPFPRIAEVEGRSDDCIVMSDGRLIPPLRVNFVDFTGHTQAEAYQIRQIRPGHIEILLVPTASFEMSSCLSRIRRDIDMYLSPDLAFDIKLVDSIPRDPSGKLRSVVSLL